MESYEFLETTESSLLHITDFSFYSIGVVLTRLKKSDILSRFANDVIIESNVSLIRLDPEDMKEIIRVEEKWGLDFDDSYQYVSAEKYDLTIVSFDSDFD